MAIPVDHEADKEKDISRISDQLVATDSQDPRCDCFKEPIGPPLCPNTVNDTPAVVLEKIGSRVLSMNYEL